MTKTKEIIIADMIEKGCKILNEADIRNVTSKIKYICKCGEEKTQPYKDFLRRACRKCNELLLQTKPEGGPVIDEKSGEEWRPIVGGWISNRGNCKNALGKPLTLCPTKIRYNIAGKHHYAARLVASAFEIENHHLLDTQSYVVHHIDGNNLNNCVENLMVITKQEMKTLDSAQYVQSERYQEKSTWPSNKFDGIEYKTIPELSPLHKIYKNGEIFNGQRFLTFTILSDGYLQFGLSSYGPMFKVHRLVCYAFHPIEGKTTLEDYKELQVNHIDGNKMNNHADNLEWVTQSQNQLHSYESGLNKKVRNIYQLDESGNIIKEFASIAQASRETGEAEFNIRSACQGKVYSTCKYFWKFKNPEESAEYSQL